MRHPIHVRNYGLSNDVASAESGDIVEYMTTVVALIRRGLNESNRMQYDNEDAVYMLLSSAQASLVDAGHALRTRCARQETAARASR